MRPARRAPIAHSEEPSLGLYPVLAQLPWPRSFIGRLAAICLLGANLPIAILVGAAIWHLDMQLSGAGAIFWVTVMAALLGSGLTILGLRSAMAPVLLSADALRRYTNERRLPELPTSYVDEAGQLMREIQNTVASFEAAQAELRIRAETDPLTGIMNRRSFFARAAEEIARTRRSAEPLALILLDIDHFKSVNDTYGHAAGDAILRLLTSTVQRQLRNYDRFARLGGEEFAVLVPGVSLQDALGVAERIRLQIADLILPILEGRRMTASFGVSVLLADDVAIDDVLARADMALYDAKKGGRNRVCWQNPEFGDVTPRLRPVPLRKEMFSPRRGQEAFWEVD